MKNNSLKSKLSLKMQSYLEKSAINKLEKKINDYSAIDKIKMEYDNISNKCK